MADHDQLMYALDVVRDLREAAAGRKPLVIVSEGKAGPLYGAILDEIDALNGLVYLMAGLVCEDREMHQHCFVTMQGAPYAQEGIDAILDCIGSVAYREADPQRARAALQLRLGILLGHTAGECVEFINSEIGQTCPCDCCGGAETVKENWA